MCVEKLSASVWKCEVWAHPSIIGLFSNSYIKYNRLCVDDLSLYADFSADNETRASGVDSGVIYVTLACIPIGLRLAERARKHAALFLI